MNSIFNIISNLKFIYLLLIIFIMIISNIILEKKEVNSNYRYLINGIVLITLGLMVNYLNDIINGIFNLNYLSVKLYIIILIITNIITIITLKKKYDLNKKILNYTLFGLISLILIISVIIFILIKSKIINSSFNHYLIKLSNISIVIFIIYLAIISLIYILNNLQAKEIIKKLNIEKIKSRLITKNTNNKESKTYLTLEELLAIPNKELFTINGINCSIIFDDSIPDNILKNYHILEEDINAKMVNGYTLEENKILKNICMKLQTNNLQQLDLNNISILNKISPEEYKFLTKIISQ